MILRSLVLAAGTTLVCLLAGFPLAYFIVRIVHNRALRRLIYIIVVTPLSGNLSLSAQTAGRLSTNFGLSIHPREGGGSMAAARYGSGTSVLNVGSKTGEVVLDQAVLLEEDR